MIEYHVFFFQSPLFWKGFEGFGACSNFWPLSASALPPLPFTSCLTMEGGGGTPGHGGRDRWDFSGELRLVCLVRNRRTEATCKHDTVNDTFLILYIISWIEMESLRK